MSLWNPDAYKRALDFAARAHGDQKVPGSGLPYVVHVTKVAMETLRACSEDPTLNVDLAMTCALLHDSVEDADVTEADLTAQFGLAVAAGVAALSKDPQLPKSERMADCLRRLKAQGREAQVVKLADRVTNLEPPPASWSVEKRLAYLAEARVIVSELGQASVWLTSRMNGKMDEYEAYCR